MDFHNALFGVGGKVGELFPRGAERDAFFESPEYREIFQMRSELRKKENVVY